MSHNLCSTDKKQMFGANKTLYQNHVKCLSIWMNFFGDRMERIEGRAKESYESLDRVGIHGNTHRHTACMIQAFVVIVKATQPTTEMRVYDLLDFDCGHRKKRNEIFRTVVTVTEHPLIRLSYICIPEDRTQFTHITHTRARIHTQTTLA